MSYYIDNTDLSTLGISVIEFSGYDVIPKRKGITQYDFDGFNGISPVNDVITLNSRMLLLKCVLVSSTMQIASNSFKTLRDLLHTHGQNLAFRVGYLDTLFSCYCKNEIKPKRLNKNINSGQVAHQFTIKLIECDPTLDLTYGQAIDGNNDSLQDGDGNNLIIW